MFYSTLISLNSKTGVATKLVDLIAWGLEWSATSDLDPRSRQLYSILAPTKTNIPWYLVSVSIDTLAIVKGPVMDKTPTCSSCPNSIFFAN